MIETVKKFYSAFNNLEPEVMTSLYHEDVVFEDPAFGQLKGDRAKAMWHMLCKSQKGKSFRVKASNFREDRSIIKANWEAFYIFSKTGRSVHNKIKAQFEFKDGLIIKHTDDFNLHQWAWQALGLKGWLIGSFPFFKKQLQQQTNNALDSYLKND